MNAPPLWQRLREARAVQILVVYLGACWFVLQLVATLHDLLSLPDWIGPVTVVLLGIGLVVIGATAWVQSLPSTTAAEEAGERPSDWEVAPSDALQRLRQGKLPHLTWGRAILGGMVALSLAIGTAAAYLLIAGGPSLLGPREVVAGGTATAVAVLPFQARGADYELYGEGMVDLLTINLEGLEGIRTINSGTVIARWRSEIGSDLTAELADALRVAGGLDARYAVRGSVVPAGGRVRIVADVFDLARTGTEPVAGVRVEGAADEILGLVDELTVELARVFVGSQPGSTSLAGAITTPSLAALEAYLRGEALYRRSLFHDAIEAYEAAVAADSTFALAHWRLFTAWTWVPEVTPEQVTEFGNRIRAFSDRLPSRQRILAEASLAASHGRSDGVDALRAHLARHPDDGEAWYWLSEYGIHASWAAGSDEAEIDDALKRAVDLEPTFGSYYIHLLSWLIAKNEEEEFRRRLAEYESVAASGLYVDVWPDAWGFMRGSEEEQSRVEGLFRTARNADAAYLSLVGFTSDDLSPRMLLVLDMVPVEIANSFPGYLRGHDVATGRRPMQVRPGAVVPWLSHVLWHLLVEDEQPVAEGMFNEARTANDALHLALMAADEGDRAARDRALALIEPGALEARPTFLGFFVGAATREQAVATTEALLLLREGDAVGARPLLDGVMGDSAHDPLAVLLAGDARAAVGDWAGAAELWRSIVPTSYRAHARLRLGRAYEALREADRAATNYRAFLTMMSDPDPAVQPLVNEARQALSRLGA